MNHNACTELCDDTLHRRNCWTCSRIRESLGELAMAHEVVVVPREGQADRLPQGTQPPVLVDDGRVIQGSGNIFAYIDELQELKRVWLKYQSDVCYMDEDSAKVADPWMGPSRCTSISPL